MQTVIHSALDLRVCADSDTFSVRSGSGSADGDSSEEGQERAEGGGRHRLPAVAHVSCYYWHRDFAADATNVLASLYPGIAPLVSPGPAPAEIIIMRI